MTQMYGPSRRGPIDEVLTRELEDVASAHVEELSSALAWLGVV
jgi:hypothetical protein